MRSSFLIFILLFSAFGALAQSGRVGQKTQPVDAATIQLNNLTVVQMFDEADGYLKAKIAEFEQKKIAYSDSLYQKTVLEQKQLAAKYAASLSTRANIAGDDFYYLGMLHWLAENSDGALENLRKFLALENPNAEKAQTARSVIVVAMARRKNFDEAEKRLAEYLKLEPVKMSERSKMESELATSYKAEKNLPRAAAHAEAAYEAAKVLFKDSTSRARALNDILGAAVKIFEIYKQDGKTSEADKTLEDLRKTSVLIQSNGIYYAAVDLKIKHLIETGRKPLALQTYAETLEQAMKDFSAKPLAEEVVRSLKRREKHYRLLGETAPEIESDKWFPGSPQTIASLRGKVVMLDFWAIWCAPCIDAFPSMIDWHQSFQKDGLVILGVTRYYGEVQGLIADNASEAEHLARFRRGYNLPYDFVVAKGQANQINYGALSIPTTVLIDRKGIVRYVETGSSPTRLQEIQSMMEKLLAEK